MDFTPTKQVRQYLYWLNKATDQDHHTLKAIHMTDTESVGMDAFRMHIVHRSTDLPAANYQIAIRKTGNKAATATPVDKQYPTYQQCVPTSTPAARIAVDRRYLADALAMPTGNCVLMDVHITPILGHPVGIIHITSPSGDCEAVVMGMHREVT